MQIGTRVKMVNEKRRTKEKKFKRHCFLPLGPFVRIKFISFALLSDGSIINIEPQVVAALDMIFRCLHLGEVKDQSI